MDINVYAAEIVKGLVNSPDDVQVSTSTLDNAMIVSIKCLDDDIKYIRGTYSKIEKALETIFWAASHGKSIKISYKAIDIVEK
jgi:predicted RNA-binding protein YlqC (UPF0109 family)